MSLNAVGMAQGPQPSGLSSIAGGIKDALPAMLDFSVCHVENYFCEIYMIEKVVFLKSADSIRKVN